MASEFLFSGIAYMNRAWLLQYKIFETAKQINVDGKIHFFLRYIESCFIKCLLSVISSFIICTTLDSCSHLLANRML